MTATLVRLGEDIFSALAPASNIEDVLLPLAVAYQGLEEARKARPDEQRRPEDAGKAVQVQHGRQDTIHDREDKAFYQSQRAAWARRESPSGKAHFADKPNRPWCEHDRR
jgi:hypothetical protein